ncbi:hypothetical protein D9756_005217 [Leucocoprinus leucothites]|uniref:Uncharacterized protein n=1 Tax=Leucocoprinus leucothites TaxID=201217 RepID=A0A8H5D7L3_9AGAR|nr:hypothetical protein D9756_005217 [Leucoagaricus leucothites]
MVLFSFRSLVYATLLASQLTVQGAVFKRQATSTDLSAAITDTPSTTPTAASSSLSPGTVTTIIIITSTAPAPDPSPIVSTFLQTFTFSGQTSVATQTVTINPTLSLPHGFPTSFIPTITQSTDEGHSSSNKGAIAGGVLGALAVIVAAFAAFVWFRRRSPKHWRNRASGRWQSFKFDNKNIGDAHPQRSLYLGEPAHTTQGDHKPDDPNPLPPLYIRDRQSAASPFIDVPGSPALPQSHARGGSISNSSHHRRESSFGSRFDVELQPSVGRAPSW